MSTMSSQTSAVNAAKTFPPTRWSVVLAAAQPASPESAAALEALCRAYWYPLYAYVRRCGQSSHDAQDLTQAFFARLLEKHWLETANPAKGRLRTFLIVALKNFMSKEWRRASAQRRGGDVVHVEFESRYAIEPASQFGPDEAFDRQWALALLDLTLNRLQGEAADFEILKESLMAERGAIDYAAVAQQLGVNAGAARVAVHRLRKRFREIYREEIAHTLAEGAELNDEMRHLAAALGPSRM
jgi:RNA polymerase sigma factor (sigma-70 family)